MNRISLQLEGVEGRENISLEDFITELTSLKKTLEQTDLVLTGGRKSMEWEVVDLRHSSPATVVLEARPISNTPWAISAQSRVTDVFRENLYLLENNEILPDRFGFQVLKAYQALVGPVKAGRLVATVKIDEEIHSILPEIVISTTQQIATETFSIGRYKGLLEFLNIHGNKSEFRIYPPAGPPFVTCHFDESLLSIAQEAVGRNVLVYGKLAYRARCPFPYYINTDSIEVLPNDKDLPDWMAIKGLYSSPTSQLNSKSTINEENNGQ
ncbi:MAG: hypothetical protein K8S62_06495 [Candidatus Sabulitectum sp.]|nr:hypothetical protein [Candidatus Sabulitectum sp.]